MVVGMAPMALGLGDGGEQNAPLGRAVIGGLVFATCATLMFVPVVFSLLHGRAASRPSPAVPVKSGEAYACRRGQASMGRMTMALAPATICCATATPRSLEAGRHRRWP